MTLNQWCERTGNEARQGPRGSVYVVVDQFDRERQELFWLDDYVVSTVSGIVHWMVKRVAPKPPAWNCG